jgi:hypothetical protein
MTKQLSLVPGDLFRLRKTGPHPFAFGRVKSAPYLGTFEAQVFGAVPFEKQVRSEDVEAVTKKGKKSLVPSEEDKFYLLWLQHGGPRLHRQVKIRDHFPEFGATNHSLDFLLPDVLAIEVNGGTYARSKMGHSSGSGIDRDYKKAFSMSLLGIPYVQLSTPQAQSLEYVRLLVNFATSLDPLPVLSSLWNVQC